MDILSANQGNKYKIYAFYHSGHRVLHAQYRVNLSVAPGSRLSGLTRDLANVVCLRSRLARRFINAARRKLVMLENQQIAPSNQGDQFAQTAPAMQIEPPSSPALERLAEIDPDELTQKQALEALYALRRLL